MIMSIFPNHNWEKQLFTKYIKNPLKILAESKDQQRKFVSYLEEKFQISKLEDWYLITSKQISELLNMKLLDVMYIVCQFYPELKIELFKKTKKSQYKLKAMLLKLFPGNEIVEEYKYGELGMLELDYYLPELKLAFEYQVTLLKIFYIYVYTYFLIH